MENKNSDVLKTVTGIGITTVITFTALAIVVGITQCVRRDWAFEDKCRKAGGVVAVINQFGGRSSREGCVKNVAPTAVEIVPIGQ